MWWPNFKKRPPPPKRRRIALVCEMIQSVLFPAFWKGLFAKRTQYLWVSLLSGINHFEHGPKRETSGMYFGGHAHPRKKTEWLNKMNALSNPGMKGNLATMGSRRVCVGLNIIQEFKKKKKKKRGSGAECIIGQRSYTHMHAHNSCMLALPSWMV